MSSEFVKRDLSAQLIDFDGESIRMQSFMQTDVFNYFVAQVSAKLANEARAEFGKALNDATTKPITLSRAITMALGSAYEDEKDLDGATRIRRFDLARRCNKEGMVKLSNSQITEINTMLRKRFPGSLIPPQAELLLAGKELNMTIEDDDEPSGNGTGNQTQET